MSCKSTKTHPPTVYACRKSNDLLARWNGEVGRYLRMHGSRIWPGIPLPAQLTLGANTSGTQECVISAGFYEVGAWNTPAGRVVAGDNSCANAGRSGTWARIGNSEFFRSLTGRYASSDWRRDIEAQVIIGVKDYQENGQQFNGTLAPLGMRPTPGSQWEYVLAAMGYVNGAAGVIRLIQAHPELARVDEQYRFGALARLAMETNASGIEVCYPIVRAWERLFCGWILSYRLGMDTRFYAVGLGDSRANIEYQLTRRWILATGCPDEGPPDPRYYSSCNGVPTGGGSIDSGSGGLATLAIAAAAAYAAVRVSQGKRLW